MKNKEQEKEEALVWSFIGLILMTIVISINQIIMNGDLNNIIAAVNEICGVEIRTRSRNRTVIDAPKKIYFAYSS